MVGRSLLHPGPTLIQMSASTPLPVSALTVDLRDLAAAPDSPVPQRFAGQPDLRQILDGERTSCWTIDGLGLVGFGRAAHVVVTGEDRFTAARDWWDRLTAGLHITDPLNRSATGPVAFGAFTFARASTASSGLVLPELVVGHDDDGAWVTLVSTRPTVGLQDVMAAWTRLVPELQPLGSRHTAGTTAPVAVDDPERDRAWCSAVADGVGLISEGRLEKLVLARAVEVRSEHKALDVSAALRNLAADYNTCWTYCVCVEEHPAPSVNRLFGATPERLVRVLDGKLHARVLAGTLDRNTVLPGADASGWAQRHLLEDPKQRAEHDFAIASLLDSVAAYTNQVVSSPDPFVLELPNVWHLASDVTAELTPGPDGTVPSALELVEAIHPTAAVCGTPTHAAGRAITQLEGMDRGLYAGPVGWLDSRHNGDFGIALRGGVQRDDHTVEVYAGCGVVGASVPDEELAETRAKLRPVLGALGVTPA